MRLHRKLVAVLAGRRSAWIMALVALGVAVAGWSRWRRRDLVPAVAPRPGGLFDRCPAGHL